MKDGKPKAQDPDNKSEDQKLENQDEASTDTKGTNKIYSGLTFTRKKKPRYEGPYDPQGAKEIDEAT